MFNNEKQRYHLPASHMITNQPITIKSVVLKLKYDKSTSNATFVQNINTKEKNLILSKRVMKSFLKETPFIEIQSELCHILS